MNNKESKKFLDGLFLNGLFYYKQTYLMAESMRVACENEDLNKAYFNSLSRCKEFISSLYKKM